MSRPVAERGTLPPRRISIAVFVVFAALGTLLGVITAGDNVLSFDVTVLEAVQRVDLPSTTTLVDLSNILFDTAGALALAALFFIAALVLHRRLFAVQLLVVIVLRAVGQLMKPVFDSPRPGLEFRPDPSKVSSTLGYPSGHAYTATIMMVMFALFLHSLDVPRWVRVVGTFVAFAVITLAMFARVKVGAHWPTDTIGGALFGIATVALMQVIVGRLAAPDADVAWRGESVGSAGHGASDAGDRRR